MRSTILIHVPPGTNRNDAQRFMESEGFTCTIEQDKPFLEIEHWTGKGQQHGNMNYIHCIRAQSDGHFLMSRHWSIAMVLNDDLVADVLVGS